MENKTMKIKEVRKFLKPCPDHGEFSIIVKDINGFTYEVGEMLLNRRKDLSRASVEIILRDSSLVNDHVIEF